jgi:hypothetical protein
VNTGVLRVTGYLLRTTFRRRRGGYVTIAVLVGLLGGLAMGSIAAARRTQSSFPVYLASTNPSDLSLPTANWQPGSPNSAGSDLSIARILARLPHVKKVENEFNINAQPLGRNGFPLPPPPGTQALGISILSNEGSTDGELSDQDRVTVVQGRAADPKRADEIVVSSVVAQVLGVHVGDVVPVGFYTNPQTNMPGYGTGTEFKTKAHLTMDMKLVGIVAFNNQVVADSLDATGTAEIVYTPALTRRLVSCCIVGTTSSLRLDHGSRDAGVVEKEIAAFAGPGGPPYFQLAPSTAVAERAIKPESIALGVFGGIAALAALLIAGLAIGRQLRFGAREGRTLRALGGGPAMTMADGIAGAVLAIVVGAVLAVVVAIGLSPLAPIGVVRPVYPEGGVALDWTVLGLGFAILVVFLSGAGAVMAYRQAPHRAGSELGRGRVQQSNVIRVVGASGLPVPAIEGIRFALDPRVGGTTVPVRSAIVGTALAFVVVIATVTFGASLDTLVSHPPLYGWNWNYELTGGGGIAPVPEQQGAALLDRDPSVAAWSAVDFGGSMATSGQEIPVFGERPGATVSPPILTGHRLDAANQLVLGGATLATLHAHLGQTVTIGIQVGAEHPTMGTGALVSSTLIPSSVSNANNVQPPGPDAVLVRLRRDADPGTSLRALDRIAHQLTLPMNYGVTVLAVQRPAEIINYRSMGTIPAFLGAALGAGAVVALGLTLVASVRRRRHDLALLKTFGFTRRQLAATVAWQSSVAVGLGAVVGVPLGIVLGRFLWDLFAHGIDAVPLPTVPGVTIAFIVIGALVLANVVAAIPGRIAASTATGSLLRTE